MLKHLLFLTLSIIFISCAPDKCDNAPIPSCIEEPLVMDITFEIITDQNDLKISETDTFRIVSDLDYFDDISTRHDNETLHASAYGYSTGFHSYDILFNGDSIGSITYNITYMAYPATECHSCYSFSLEQFTYNDEIIPLDSLNSYSYKLPLHL